MSAARTWGEGEGERRKEGKEEREGERERERGMRGERGTSSHLLPHNHLLSMFPSAAIEANKLQTGHPHLTRQLVPLMTSLLVYKLSYYI